MSRLHLVIKQLSAAMPANDPLSSVLAVIGNQLPAALISPSVLSSMMDVGQIIPRSVTPVFGFECPLADPEAHADLLTYHNARSGAGNFLGQSDKNPADQLTGSNWQTIKRFASVWQQNPVLQQGLDDIWLEFDIDTATSQLPEPSLFFGPKLAHYENRCTELELKQHLVQLIRDGLQPLYPDGQPHTEQVLLRQIVDALPAYGRIFQVGKMLSRQTTGFRLCLDNLSVTDIHDLCATFSDDQAWVDTVQFWLDQVSPFAWKIRPAIDLSNRLLPKIGLECSFRNGSDEQPLIHWHQFINYLIINKLCDPGKGEALLQYPRIIRSNPANDAWPSGLKTAELLVSQQRQSAFVLTLHHIKLTIAHDMLPVAKAYMAVEHQWLARTTTLPTPEKWENDLKSL